MRAIDDLELPEEEQQFKPAELAMAKQLVAAMTGEFHADDYRDDYRQALMSVIEAKISGQEITAPAPVETGAKLVDLMSVLEASVNAARESRQAEAAGVAPIAKARRSKAAAAKAATGKKQAAEGAAGADGQAAEATAASAKPARKRKSA